MFKELKEKIKMERDERYLKIMEFLDIKQKSEEIHWMRLTAV